MEGGNTDMPQKPVSFHSDNIGQSKAHEKREVFVNVVEKRSVKQTAEEFQKKFANAKSHAAESRRKIQANGLIPERIKKKFPLKKVLLIGIPVLALGIGGFVVYQNWDEIYYKYFEVSREKTVSFLKANDKSTFETEFTKLVNKAPDATEKSLLYVWKAEVLNAYCGEPCSKEILESAHKSEETFQSKNSALVIYKYEKLYGDESKASEWLEKSESRENYGGEVG